MPVCLQCFLPFHIQTTKCGIQLVSFGGDSVLTLVNVQFKIRGGHKMLTLSLDCMHSM